MTDLEALAARVESKDVAAIAAGLTKASRRALVRIGSDWTREGAPGPSRSDAYSLGWGRNGNLRLIDRQSFDVPGSMIPGWRYRLTPLGLAVRSHLTAGATHDR